MLPSQAEGRAACGRWRRRRGAAATSREPGPSMLPAHLAERLEPNAPAPRTGQFVIYWMRVAARATENPALDVALAAAKALRLPVFVYHALAERHRYASDRLHTFFLEGARDVQRALRERGIGYVFDLERPGPRAPALRRLAADAALVVTDFVPLPPFLRRDAGRHGRGPGALAALRGDEAGHLRAGPGRPAAGRRQPDVGLPPPRARVRLPAGARRGRPPHPRVREIPRRAADMARARLALLLAHAVSRVGGGLAAVGTVRLFCVPARGVA